MELKITSGFAPGFGWAKSVQDRVDHPHRRFPIMRRACFTLTVLLAAVPAAIAQIPLPPGARPPISTGVVPVAGGIPVPAAAPLPAALEAHLKAWETKSASIVNMYTECELVRKNLLLRKEAAYSGSITCMKPSLALMKIDNKADKADYLGYVCDGTSVYEYSGRDKTVTQHKIPPGGKNNVGDNLLIEFMSGKMTADDVKSRFDIKLVKEEEFYVHLQIGPKQERDKQEFESMLLVLFSDKAKDMAYLPAVVVMYKNNAQELEQWTFKKPMSNVQGIKQADFSFKAPPKDWQVKQAGAATPSVPPTPKVARPAGP